MQNRLEEESADGYISTSKNNQFYVAAQPTQIKSASDSLWKSNNGRYSSTNLDIRELRTPEGELYGFAYNGEIYLDETKLSPNAAIHEYTHLWDKPLMEAEPNSHLGKLWTRGKELMKQTSLWKQIAEDKNYGRKWASKSKAERENLIASEIHSRLVGENGEKLLMDMAKEKGAEGIIGKLKQWITDVWKALGKTFGTWTQAELDKLTLDDFVHMTIRDFVEGINPNNVKPEASTAEQSTKANNGSQKVEQQSKYPKGIAEKKSTREVWDIMTPEQQKRAMALGDYKFETLFSEDIDGMYKQKNGKVNKIKKEKIDEEIEELENLKLRQKNSEATEVIDVKKETKWLKEVLPQLSDDEHLRIVDGLIRISNSDNPDYAWGMYKKGVMTIADNAARGTVYHEAFHAVVDTLLSNDE